MQPWLGCLRVDLLGGERRLRHRPEHRRDHRRGVDLEARLGEHLAVLAGVPSPAVALSLSCIPAVIAASATLATRSATSKARHPAAAFRAAITAASIWARSAAGASPTISAGLAGLCTG